MNPSFVEIAAAVLFALALLHTFSTRFFERLAARGTRHAGLWHLLGEVEAVFGFWALILLLFMAAASSPAEAVAYLEGRNFTEPLFVFVIMVIAATRPVIALAQCLVDACARRLPFNPGVAGLWTTLALVPLLGSLITEPAAMTLGALMLGERYYRRGLSPRLAYLTLGVLFVNISIGGVLTPYAAPPVLMVAGTWGWDLAHMLTHFGWKAACAVVVNASLLVWVFRRELAALEPRPAADEDRVPLAISLVHLLFMAAVVFSAHHAVVFVALFLFFLGFTQAYARHQTPLLLREGLLVAFFLGGLVVIGGMQKWWLQPLLQGVDDLALFFGAVALTAVTDNAALTYLGSLIEGSSEGFRYALVAGAVTGGGLTVIANAPNPAGQALLRPFFEGQAISPGYMLLAALPPTVVAALAFLLL